MSEKSNGNPLSKVARKSIQFFKKRFSKSKSQIKVDPKKHTVKIEDKTFNNPTEIINCANEKIAKYQQAAIAFGASIRKKELSYHRSLGGENNIEDFKEKFSEKFNGIITSFSSLKFLPENTASIDNKKEHNEEDYNLFCENKDYFKFIISDKTTVPSKFATRKDGSKRESKLCSKVIYMISYLPLIMSAYKKDEKQATSSLEALEKEIDAYIKLKRKWSNQPDKSQKRQMIIGNRKPSSASKSSQTSTSSKAKKTQSSESSKRSNPLIGRARKEYQEKRMKKTDGKK